MSTESSTTDESQRYRPQTDSTTFIETSGGILTEQLVRKLRERDCSESAVDPAMFALPGEDPLTEAALEDEIAEAWEGLQERWDTVTQGNELFGMDVSAAREKWILKLLEALDFAPSYINEHLEADGVTADLSHYGWPHPESVSDFGQMDGAIPPICHTIEPGAPRADAPNIELDDGDHPGAAGRQKSPHDELQEYLKASDDQLWGVVTDGLKLRILRDYYHTYTRGYVDFDLENIFTNRNYGDFRALYRLCHASRFTTLGETESGDEEDDAESPLEQLHQIALSTGVKVGIDLQSNVVSALEALGNGFLDESIKTSLQEGGQDAVDDYYQDLLYVVYRLLFLMFAEQRGMMSQRDSLYSEEYSITKLREQAERREEGDRNTDIWEGLKATFRLVSMGDESLGVPGYNGGLFDNDKLQFILDAECPNENLLSAIHNLTHIEQGGYQQRISYADLGVEEIGAVYESLLEFTPQLAETVIELEDRTISSGSFYLDDRGMERKETGSYYTDPGLIHELIQSSLKPVVEDRVNGDASIEVQEQQLLDITVCDPACGSGAFLIAANNYLGQRLAEIRSESLYPDEQTIRQARRSVVQHCMYGVDLNPMAAELAKVSLWINSAVEDKPLSFLDHRIKQGNSLIGTTPELLSQGIPVDAFETSSGRDWHKGNEIRKRVRKENSQIGDEDRQVRLDRQWGTDDDNYLTLAEQLDELEERDIGDIYEKEEIYEDLRGSERFRNEMLTYDVWTAAFYWPLDGSADEYPSPNTIERIRHDPPNPSDAPSSELSGLQSLCKRATRIAEEQSFFHWPLEFPLVHYEGGFDCILGNPPWDKVTVEETKFFATSAPEIADSSLTQSEREKKIEKLEDQNPQLYKEYERAIDKKEGTTKFIKQSGRFPLGSHGILNLYAPFAELSLKNINKNGRSGIIVPTGIATASDTQDFFHKLVDERRISSLLDFENRNRIFPDVDGRYKFCLLALVGQDIPQESFDLAFYLTELAHLNDESRRYQLAPEDIELVNPNTRNCPVFRNKEDAELVVSIYNGSTVIKHEHRPDIWDVDISRMFNAGDDSHLFIRKTELDDNGWSLRKNIFERDEDVCLPVYESKMVHQFDHRYASYEGVAEEDVKNKNPRILQQSQKDDPQTEAQPPYWIPEEEYKSKWNEDKWHLVLRGVTNVTNRRTTIASLLPRGATEHTLNHILDCNAEEAAILLACLNSYVLDYVTRRKLGNEFLSHFVIKQLPVPKPEQLQSMEIGQQPIIHRVQDLVLQLVYNSEGLEPFADELGFEGNPFSYTNPDGHAREEVRFELEAILCQLYGVDLDDLDRIFDDFKQVKSEDVKKYGYYRTREEIKKRFEELAPKITDKSEEDQ